jgi:hypothetical protein
VPNNPLCYAGWVRFHKSRCEQMRQFRLFTRATTPETCWRKLLDFFGEDMYTPRHAPTIVVLPAGVLPYGEVPTGGERDANQA